MKLSKETPASTPNIPILRVEDQVSLTDCEILAVGLRKLSHSNRNLALDLSLAQPLSPPVRARLEAICLESSAKCSGDFWIIGPDSWAHVSTMPQFEELQSRPPLAASCMDSWLQQRTLELREKYKSLSNQLIKGSESRVFSLRRENSRLKRRLGKLEAESESLPAQKAPTNRDLARLRERIASSIEHAIATSGRRP